MNKPFPVMIAHNRYRQRGGEDVCFESDVDLLRERGHDVHVYETSNDTIEGMNKARLFARTTWSPESARKIETLLSLHRPAVLHLYNTFPLISPSVCYAAARCRAPVVFTLSNYRWLCPNALLMREGKVCEDCLGRRFAWPALRHACYRDSRGATAAVAVMEAAHRMLRTWDRRVSRFITPSGFTRRKYIDAGFPANRIAVRANYLAHDPGMATGRRAGAVFVGALHPWKGVNVLLDAWRSVATTEELRIVGAGPAEPKLRQLSAGDPRVRFMGARDAAGVYEAIKNSRVLVFPSLAFETFGRTLIEAFACGTPVIASRLGAARELVEDGVTGWLFQAGDAAGLADKIGLAMSRPEDVERKGRAARIEYERHYTAGKAYARLMEVYNEAIEEKPNNKSP